MALIEGSKSRTHDDVKPDILDYSPTSSPSSSPLILTEGDTSAGKRMDQVVQTSKRSLSRIHIPPSHVALDVECSGGQFTAIAPSSLAQEEQRLMHTHAMQGQSGDYEWEASSWIP